MRKTGGRQLEKFLFVTLIGSTLLLLAACGSSEAPPKTPVNQQPTADAGSNATVTTGASVILDGSNSSDPEGETLTYSWMISSKPAGSSAALSNAIIMSPGFVADEAGSYVIQLVVNDGAVDSTADEVVITVNSLANSPPVANAGDDLKVTTGTAVNLDGGGSFDLEEDALFYQWTLISKPVGSSASLINGNQVSPVTACLMPQR